MYFVTMRPRSCASGPAMGGRGPPGGRRVAVFRDERGGIGTRFVLAIVVL